MIYFEHFSLGFNIRAFWQGSSPPKNGNTQFEGELSPLQTQPFWGSSTKTTPPSTTTSVLPHLPNQRPNRTGSSLAPCSPGRGRQAGAGSRGLKSCGFGAVVCLGNPAVALGFPGKFHPRRDSWKVFLKTFTLKFHGSKKRSRKQGSQKSVGSHDQPPLRPRIEMCGKTGVPFLGQGGGVFG